MNTPPGQAEIASAIQEVLDYWVSIVEFRQRYLGVPGVQAAVIVNDDAVYSGAVGSGDLESGIALTDKHLFRVASQTKVVTAVAVLQLAQEERLRLSDQIARHMPALVGSELGTVTVGDLLSHAGGVIRDGQDGDFWQFGREFPDRDELIQIACDPEAAVLGSRERFKYSNVGVSLLGLIIESVSREAYRDRVQRHVFDRLGLVDTGFGVPPGRAADFAVGYTAFHAAETPSRTKNVETRAFDPATGMFSTAYDMARFFAALCPGDDTLLSDDLKSEMCSPAWDTYDFLTPPARCGLAVMIQSIGHRTVVGHPGGFPGHQTVSLVDRDTRIAVSVCTNAIGGPAEELAQALFRLMSLAESTGAAPDRTDAHRFTGRFTNMYHVLDIAVLGGRLYGLDPRHSDPTASPIPLDIIDGDSLRFAGGDSYGETVPFVFGEDGTVQSIRGFARTTMVPEQRNAAVARA